MQKYMEILYGHILPLHTHITTGSSFVLHSVFVYLHAKINFGNYSSLDLPLFAAYSLPHLRVK